MKSKIHLLVTLILTAAICGVLWTLKFCRGLVWLLAAYFGQQFHCQNHYIVIGLAECVVFSLIVAYVVWKKTSATIEFVMEYTPEKAQPPP